MKKKEIYLVLDNIRSRENVGSIFRTADATGVNKIYLCGITPIQPHEKISKTALGAEMCVPWESYKQTWRLLDKLKKEGINIVALERFDKFTASKLKIHQKNIFKYKVPKNKKIALVLGNEVKGISPKILKYCDEVVHIPMYGKKESLNVAVAFGIAAYLLNK